MRSSTSRRAWAPSSVDREIAPTVLERMRAVHGRRESSRSSRTGTCCCGRAAARSARAWSTRTASASSSASSATRSWSASRTRARSPPRASCSAASAARARAIAIHLQHADGDALNARRRSRAQAAVGAIPRRERAGLAERRCRPTPELRITPDDRRLAEAGWRRPELGTVVRTLGDGTWLGEHFDGDRRLDDHPARRRRPRRRICALGAAPLATPHGGVLSSAELAQVDTVLAPNQLRRVDRRRTVTLTVDPPATMSLEEALDIVDADVVPALRKAAAGRCRDPRLRQRRPPRQGRAAAWAATSRWRWWCCSC